MKKIQFDDSELLYPVGLGTWQMGENNSNKQNELDTIFHAIDSGIQLIDTAEMYGEGKTELLLKEVVKQKRNKENRERQHIGLLISGPEKTSWSNKNPSTVDFFTLSGLIERLIERKISFLNSESMPFI